MSETTTMRSAADVLISIGAVWLALTLSGFASLFHDTIGYLATAILTLTLYILMLVLYTLATGPGRRSGFRALAAGAVLYPLYIVALLFAIDAVRSIDWALNLIMLLGSGATVGFQVEGGPDTPIEFYLLPWLLNFLIPIVLVLALRALLGERAEQSSGG